MKTCLEEALLGGHGTRGISPEYRLFRLGTWDHRVGLIVDLVFVVLWICYPCTMYCVLLVLSCVMWRNCVKRRYNVGKRKSTAMTQVGVLEVVICCHY